MLIVPNGTQIVTNRESKVTSENRFHPPGAVGRIIAAPVDATHSYLIEFLDSSTASLKRGEFSIRKQFQTETAFNASENGDLQDFIIYRCIVGSRAFGLDDENSDTDYRGIYLPPARLHWSLYGVPEQLENKDREECFWELQKFLILALKANPNILECLNTPLVEYKNEIADELLSIKRIFFSKLVYQTYNGYVMSQFKRLEQDLQARGEIRWKHAMHLVRLILQGIEILKSSELNVRVSTDRERLLAVKRGEISWEALNVWRLNLHREFEKAFAETTLPDRPDYEKANEFLIDARRRMV
jgi:predicted nucleotidyltransferase